MNELTSFELTLYFMEHLPDTQCGRKNIKKENNFSYKVRG